MDSSAVPVITFAVNEGEAGRRLDTVLASRLPFLSRSCAGQLIREKRVRVNGTPRKAAYILHYKDSVQGEVPAFPPTPSPEPEPIPLHILFEDDQIIVINKPPGMVIHPAPGHPDRTLVNALIHHCPNIYRGEEPLRPGIVHRLDKDTSGALIVAKTALAYDHLKKQFKNRQVRKQYMALVYGHVDKSTGIVQTPVGRHPVDRKKMSTSAARGRPAETSWRVRMNLDAATLLDVRIRTGRTHQIRVHCADMGHPVVGDFRYGGKKRWKDASSAEARHILKSVKRQMLHAWRLTCSHPSMGHELGFESPIPDDMEGVISALQSSMQTVSSTYTRPN